MARVKKIAESSPKSKTKAKKVVAKQGRGRPTKYQHSFAEQAYKLCLLGTIDAGLADFFSVNTDTIYEWKNRHPEFSEALKRGKLLADSQVAMSLFNRATGCVVKTQQAIKLTTKVPVLDDEGKPTRQMKQTEEIEVVDLIQEIPPDTTAGIFWLKNRQPKEWRDKQEVLNTYDPGEDENIEITIRRSSKSE